MLTYLFIKMRDDYPRLFRRFWNWAETRLGNDLCEYFHDFGCPETCQQYSVA